MKMGLTVVANWKMYPDTPDNAVRLFKETIKASKSLRGVEVVVCAPHIYLRELRAGYKGKSVLLGAQNVAAHARGAHTGEVSALMLKNSGMTHAIIGHSERRALGESDALIGEKVKQALEAGLYVIVCVGEQTRDDHGGYLQVIKTQLLEALKHTSPKELYRVSIAYEPIWAIGKSAKDALVPSHMHEMSIYIRKVIVEKFNDPEIRVPVLYGGSVEALNAYDMLMGGEVQGFLVGHASLGIDTFKPILDAAYRFKRGH